MSKAQIAVFDITPEIPKYVKSMPFEIKAGWISAFNIASDLYGFERAVQVADSYALKKIQELKEKPVKVDVIKEILIDELISMPLQAVNEEMIVCADDGTITIDACLADDSYNSDGKRFSGEALISMAQQINEKGLALPDIEHKEFKALAEMYGNDFEKIKEELKNRKGLLTKIKAFVNKGKLFIKAQLDKRYKNHISRYKNLSIEAKGMADMDNDPYTYLTAEPFSFTFTDTPKIAVAKINNVY